VAEQTTSLVQTDQALIERAMAFPIEEIVALYASDLEVPIETAMNHECELKRWLVLSALNPEEEYVMLSSIDEIWHAFILFTRRYAEFCNDVLGRFVHHRPRVNGEWYRGRIIERYEGFHRDYEATFGEPPRADVWPSPEELALSLAEDLPAN
jgi:hypothetical protein